MFHEKTRIVPTNPNNQPNEHFIFSFSSPLFSSFSAVRFHSEVSLSSVTIAYPCKLICLKDLNLRFARPRRRSLPICVRREELPRLCRVVSRGVRTRPRPWPFCGAGRRACYEPWRTACCRRGMAAGPIRLLSLAKATKIPATGSGVQEVHTSWGEKCLESREGREGACKAARCCVLCILRHFWRRNIDKSCFVSCFSFADLFSCSCEDMTFHVGSIPLGQFCMFYLMEREAVVGRLKTLYFNQGLSKGSKGDDVPLCIAFPVGATITLAGRPARFVHSAEPQADSTRSSAARASAPGSTTRSATSFEYVLNLENNHGCGGPFDDQAR